MANIKFYAKFTIEIPRRRAPQLHKLHILGFGTALVHNRTSLSLHVWQKFTPKQTVATKLILMRSFASNPENCTFWCVAICSPKLLPFTLKLTMPILREYAWRS